jgi:hypothetical protein
LVLYPIFTQSNPLVYILTEHILDNLREIYKGYVRFQIYTNGLDCVKIGYNTKKGKEENPQSQHPSDKVMDWVKEVGTDIVEWMDK